jgi:hypothetical protein
VSLFYLLETCVSPYYYNRLLPLLKKFGIRFYGYSPLAGSILAGKDLVVAATDGSRFDPKASEFIAQYYNARYPGLIPAVHELRDEAVSLTCIHPCSYGLTKCTMTGQTRSHPPASRVPLAAAPLPVRQLQRRCDSFRRQLAWAAPDDARVEVRVSYLRCTWNSANNECSEEGPLPEDIVKLVDALYLKNKGLLWHYSGVP